MCRTDRGRRKKKGKKKRPRKGGTRGIASGVVEGTKTERNKERVITGQHVGQPNKWRRGCARERKFSARKGAQEGKTGFQGARNRTNSENNSNRQYDYITGSRKRRPGH